MENKEKSAGLEIDFRRLLFVVRKHILVILLVGVLVGGLSFGYAKMTMDLKYSSSTMFYVKNQTPDSPGYTNSQVAAAQDLARTYMVILKTRSVLTQINEVAGLNYSYSQLKGMVSTDIQEESMVFWVKFTCSSSQDAYKLAHATQVVLPERINAMVAEVEEETPLWLVDEAVEVKSPTGPDYQKYAILGGLVGIMLTLIIVVIKDLLDTSIHSEEYLSDAYEDVPLLAVIPAVSDAKNGRYSYHYGNRQEQTQGGAK